MAHQPLSSHVDYSRLEKTPFRRASVRELKTLVVGAGALGNEVVRSLGMLGVGKILVVDPDLVSPANLTSSFLLRSEEALGRNKAIALAEAARRFFPDTVTIAIDSEIADVGFQEIAGADILFGCVDSDLARLEIAYIATKLDIPVADAGLGTHNYAHGRVSYFPGRNGACYGCRLTQRRRRELFNLWEASVRSCWTGVAEDLPVGGYSITPTMASVTGSIQVQLGLQRLLAARQSNPPEAASVEITLDPIPCFESFRVPQSKSCPLHAIDGELMAMPKSSFEPTIEELLRWAEGSKKRDAVLILDWPICTQAQCVECGLEWQPMKRLATLRRVGVCPACGRRHIVEKETLRCLDRNCRWVGCTLTKLGLPQNHLHTIRF